MASIHLLISLLMLLSTVLSQRIPYAHLGGRNATQVLQVENRFKNFHAAVSRNASAKELDEICGYVAEHKEKCPLVFRPTNEATSFCDSVCCLGGWKVGHCGKVGFVARPNWLEILEKLATGRNLDIWEDINPDFADGCSCSNEWEDVKCGPDGSVGGIRCPDRSACWRKCCRDGREGGRCSWGVKCKCD